MTHTYDRKKIILICSIILTSSIVFILIATKNRAPGSSSPLDRVPLDQEEAPVATSRPSQPKIFTEHAALTSDNIIWFTNYYRSQQGLAPLILSPQLRNSAYYKSLDMLNHQYFDHYRPQNRLGFDNFVDNQKYSFIKIGENLAQGDFTTSKEIVDSWMNSPYHRQNILSTSYTEIGVSVDYGTLYGKRVVLITQHFGLPKESCPRVDESLRSTIGKLSQKMIKLRDRIDTEESVDDLITEYNRILREREALVTTYNNQVTSFDACVSRG